MLQTLKMLFNYNVVNISFISWNYINKNIQFPFYGRPNNKINTTKTLNASVLVFTQN